MHALGMRLQSAGKKIADTHKPDPATGWTRQFMDGCYLARLDLVDNYPLQYSGVIASVRHEFVAVGTSPRRIEARIVLSLNWVVRTWDEKDPDYGGTFEIMLDPTQSPVRRMDKGGGNEVFAFLADRSYIVIRKGGAPFAGDPETPRVYTWF